MNSPIEYNPDKLAVTYDREGRIVEYLQLLLEENKRVNLVSRETTVESARLMALESLLPLEVLEKTPISSYLDIGSGGGLPAIPLLLTGAISGRAVLMERIGKKALATERVIEALGLQAQVLAESFPWGPLKPGFDLITLKWVKLTPNLLSKIESSLSRKGKFVHYSSESLSSDIISSHTYTFHDPQADVIKGFTVYQK